MLSRVGFCSVVLSSRRILLLDLDEDEGEEGEEGEEEGEEEPVATQMVMTNEVEVASELDPTDESMDEDVD